MAKKTKACPSCAMDVDNDAKVCPVCEHEFEQFPPWMKIVAVLLVIIFSIYFIF